jgi:GNAT superfamily N-acetyltransferase
MSGFLTPRPIRALDSFEGFDCGEAELNDWLVKRAWANEQGDASRTFVTSPSAGGGVAGYYALAAGSVDPAEVPGRVRRNMPAPIPVVILARLAVDKRYQGQGVGSSLLRDAIVRAVAASGQIGIKAMIIHALNDKALAFYTGLGFTESPPGHLTCVATMADLRRTLGVSAGSTG